MRDKGAGRVEQGHAVGLLIVTAVVVATFGPYVAPGIRLEQLAVYGSAVVILPLTVFYLRLGTHTSAIIALMSAVIGVAAFGAVAAPVNRTPWSLGSPRAGMDNLLLPVMVLLIVHGLLVWRADPVRLARRIALWTVIAMMVNTLAAVQQYNGRLWTRWWDSAGIGTSSTATNAAQNGRFSGLLNQPFEAGLLYGLALLCAIHLWSDRPRRLLPVLAVLILGGVLTVSKVFLLVAIPLACWQMLKSDRGRRTRLVVAVALVVSIYTMVRTGVLPEWTGANQLRLILPGGRGTLVDTFTAGRYGQTGTLQTVTQEVLGGPRWFGFGAGGLQVPYDSGYVEALVQAGLVGAVLHTLIFVTLVMAWRSYPQTPERTLFGYIILLLIVADLGGPALTGNRVATIVWLLVGTLLAAGHATAKRRTTTEPANREIPRKMATSTTRLYGSD